MLAVVTLLAKTTLEWKTRRELKASARQTPGGVGR
jgi:hypothetical protein